ncbi:ion transporter [Pelagicoccus sp. NFK12]|uniref:Ion transporter n=1 Tax=Pelagicoccus enzymogenes TaxID=2773457 RepID=A0A927FBX1_9BACT|nr:potassium channel family protein [Pelagicoccus enzymogenes]MBD5780951.1 ion transporter [Pelagicoccus enzymogenes]
MFLQLIRKFISRRSDTSMRLWKILLVASGLNLLFGVGFYFAERNHQEGLTFIDSLWWAMVTMTTVGYGDYFPQTFAGRFLIAYPCFIVGIGLLGYLLASVTETVLQRVSLKRKGAMKLSHKNHIIICNYPSLDKVTQILDELQANSSYADKKVALISNELDELPSALAKRGVLFVKGLPTSDETLYQANVTECDGVFVLPAVSGDPASDAQTYAIGSIIELIEQETGTPIKTVVELVSSRNLRMMERAQTDGIILADGINERMIVQEFFYPGIRKTFEQLITSREGSQFYIHETSLQSQRFVEVQIATLQHPVNMQLVGIIKNDRHILNPPKDTLIDAGDRLIILADKAEDFLSVERDIQLKQSA